MSDPYSAGISAAFGTASTIIQTIGLDKQSKAEEEAAQAAAIIAREKTIRDVRRSRQRTRQELASQRGRVVRSGISLEGSQMDLLISNTYEYELETTLIQRFGDMEVAQHQDRAKAIGKARQLGRAAGIMQSFVMGGQAAYAAYGAYSESQSESPQAGTSGTEAEPVKLGNDTRAGRIRSAYQRRRGQ